MNSRDSEQSSFVRVLQFGKPIQGSSPVSATARGLTSPTSIMILGAHADEFSDCFNLSQTPIQFQQVDAPLKTDYFMNHKRPPTVPDDD